MMVDNERLQRSADALLHMLESMGLNPLEKVFVLSECAKSVAVVSDMRFKVVEKSGEEVTDAVKELMHSVFSKAGVGCDDD